MYADEFASRQQNCKDGDGGETASENISVQNPKFGLRRSTYVMCRNKENKQLKEEMLPW